MRTSQTRDHDWSPDDVQVLRWPEEEERRQQLAAKDLPRLLVLDQACDAPDEWDCLEDWIRSPYSAVDFETRRATLAARARGHRAS